MKLITRLLAGPLAMFALTAAVYRTEKVTINFPDGWSTPKANANGVIESTAPDASRVSCNVEFSSPEGLLRTSSVELEESYGHVLDAAEWAEFLDVKASDLTVVASERRTVDGQAFHIATLHLKTAQTDAMARYGFFISREQITIAGCYALTKQFADYSKVFDQTVTSLRPH